MNIQELMANPLYRRRKWTNRVMLVLAGLAIVVGLFWLSWIMWTLFSKGLAALSPTLFTEITPPAGETGGGLANAILGSVLMVAVATMITTPIGILAGTYLAEYARNNTLSKIVRFINDILLSAPSIVVGMFVFLVAYYGLGLRQNAYSGWAGAFALAIIMLPVVVRTTDDMLKLVPNTLREAAVALGTPYWKMIFTIGYRAARTGMLTGLLLGVARIFGETAPLLFTAFGNNFWSSNLSERMASLPQVINQFGLSPDENWNQLAWGGAILITLLVLFINIVTRWYASKHD
ncbi:MAG: phosphate ABC transporter permease PstA [Hydromonas sp.]|jgi:phosphate transport system permease protein|nr:phosphate ABC transporter permease PstA [Hydromonas sp.]MBP6294685.1 phosphate ABC transporter permease PstA [Hydromonas sp.]